MKPKHWLVVVIFISVLIIVWAFHGKIFDQQPVPTSQVEQITLPAFPEVKVHFIDVGQADSIYIQLPEHVDVLIDAGNAEDGPTVVNYLKDQGVDDLELLIATHPHEDHIGGMPEVIKAFPVKELIDSGKTSSTKTYQNYASLAQAEGCLWEQDNYQSFSWGSIKLQILTGQETWSDLNDYSVAARLDCNEIEFLFSGDCGRDSEAILPGDISAEILKVGHHGGSSSSSRDFLERVKPKLAIISVGSGNNYGHPASAVLKRLQEINSSIIRTDINGTVVVSTNGFEYSINTMR